MLANQFANISTAPIQLTSALGQPSTRCLLLTKSRQQRKRNHPQILEIGALLIIRARRSDSNVCSSLGSIGSIAIAELLRESSQPRVGFL